MKKKEGKNIFHKKWAEINSVAAIEDIAICSEVYRCYKVMEEAEGGLKNYYWFAPEIGLVKWKIGKTKGILKECLKEEAVQQNN